jgi:Icc protein
MASTIHKIVFITDLHIDKEDYFPSGRDTRSQLIDIIHHLKKSKFDGIILGGDLCNQTGDTLIYKWIYELFKAHNLSVHPISGNHDTSSLLADVFGLQNYLTYGALYYKILIGQVPCLLLDTSSGSMDATQWRWIEKEVATSPFAHQYIFMHHPPVICHSKHMEPKYMFSQMEAFKSLCEKYSHKTFHIIAGHYHIEKTVIHKNMYVYVSPSTYVQIDPDSTSFQMMHPHIGYRMLLIEEDGCVNTHALYL